MTTQRSSLRFLPIIAGACAAFVGAIAVAICASGRVPQFDQGPAMSDAEMASIAAAMRIVPFQGVDHRGAPIDQAVFRDHWTVVSFGFTHCALACPMMHGQIARISETLAGHPVKFLTISVDPDHDTVDQMAAYMKPWGVKNDAWTFARVDKGTLTSMLAGLSLPGIEADSSHTVNLPDGTTMPSLLHPTRFFVVGPDGAVKGLWRGMDPDDVDAMVRWILKRVG